MPEDNRDYKKEMLNWMRIVEEAGKIGQGLQSHVEKERIDAQRNRDRYCLEGLLNDPFGENDKPLYTLESWSNDLTDEERAIKLQNYLPTRQTRSLDMAASTFYASPDGVLKDKGRYNSKLEKLALPLIQDEKTREFVDDEHAQVIAHYLNYRAKEQLVKKIESGAPLTKEEQQEIMHDREVIVRNKSAEYTAFLKEKHGIEGKAAEAWAHIYARQYSTEPNKNDIKAIAEEIKKKAEDRLKEVAGDRDYKDILSEASGKALTKMIKSGNAEYQQMAVQMAYAVLKE